MTRRLIDGKDVFLIINDSAVPWQGTVHFGDARAGELLDPATGTITPLCAYFFWGSDVVLLAVGVIAMALIGKHWQNLQRLMAGTEPKIGAKKKAGSAR